MVLFSLLNGLFYFQGKVFMIYRLFYIGEGPGLHRLDCFLYSAIGCEDNSKAIPPSMEGEGRRLVTLYKEDAYHSLMSLIQDFRDNLINVKKDAPKGIVPVVLDIELNLDELEKLARNANASSPKSRPSGITPIEARREEKVKTLISAIMSGLDDLEKGVQQTISLRSSTISSLSSQARKVTIKDLFEGHPDIRTHGPGEKS